MDVYWLDGSARFFYNPLREDGSVIRHAAHGGRKLWCNVEEANAHTEECMGTGNSISYK
jgi:hypothetical protein